MPAQPRNPGVEPARDSIGSSRPSSRHLSGSRRGPVNERATTQDDPVARERKSPAQGPDRDVAAGHRTRPCHLAKVGVAGSNPVVRSRETPGQGRCEPALWYAQCVQRGQGSRRGPVSYTTSSRRWATPRASARDSFARCDRQVADGSQAEGQRGRSRAGVGKCLVRDNRLE